MQYNQLVLSLKHWNVHMETTNDPTNNKKKNNKNKKDFRFHSHGAVVFSFIYYVVVEIEERVRWFVFNKKKMQCKQNIAICGITG